MIKNLQKKFILINMSLVFLVLLVVFGVLLFSSYGQLQGQSHMILQAVMERSRDGDVPQDQAPGDRFSVADPQEKQGGSTEPSREAGAPEKESRGFFAWAKEEHTPLTPTFTVLADQEGTILSMEENNFSSAEEICEAATAEALASDAREGILTRMDLRYLKQETDTGTKIVFADRSNEIYVMKRFLINSMCVGLGALVAFFIISLFLSSWALKPVQMAWQRQREFVADASHELRTPLTIILANVGILRSHKEESIAEHIKWVDNTREEANRMKMLVDDLLFLAKADAGSEKVPMCRLNLSELMWNCLLTFESVAFEKGVAIDTKIQEDLFIWASEGQIRQLLMILLDNACKYAGAGSGEREEEAPKMRVSLEKKQAQISIQVNNNGIPISPETLPHLFERFYRTDKARARESGGCGLGLAIAKTIAETHRAEISVKSTEKEGTTFTVSFHPA